MNPSLPHLKEFRSHGVTCELGSEERCRFYEKDNGKIQHDQERYAFLPMIKEEEEVIGDSSEEVQQPPSPALTQDSPSTSSKGEPKTRSLQELFDVTDEIFLLFV
ncbi:hypothetical protein Tco_1304024 [Tanacetum coccineum]